MPTDAPIDTLAALLRETGEAHHRAFAAAGGDDPEWPLWYAEYLHDRVAPLFAAPLTRSRLVFCLVAIDEEHRTADPTADWIEFYARRILECYGSSAEPRRDRLALYYFDHCGYCSRVLRVIEELGIDVELRDIFADREHLEALRRARGRRTVPVLRIYGADGQERWMPESAEIVRYLRASYGESAA